MPEHMTWQHIIEVTFQIQIPLDVSFYELSNVKETSVRKHPFVSKHFANVSKGSQTASTSSSSVYFYISSFLSVTWW
jgi:hypothetical protein